MTVERIETIEAFERVREAYETAYARDPHRSVFVSWPWLRSYFGALRRTWTLLVARDGDRYAGFCLLVRSGLSLGPLALYREMALGAYPTADYGSLVIDGDEARVLDALAAEIATLEFDVLRLCNVRDPRVARLVERLSNTFDVEEEERNLSHFVPLPATWAQYMVRLNGGKQYVARRHKAWRGAQLDEASDANVDLYIETLLRLHNRRWNSNLGSARRTYGRLFREAYDRGCCRIAVLWSADRRPLAAQAAFADAERRSWGVYMLAYDCDAGKGSPGIGMLAKVLEHAIDEGFSEYDFLRGDEPYKARFGTEKRLLENYVVRRRDDAARRAERRWHLARVCKAHLRRMLFGRTL